MTFNTDNETPIHFALKAVTAKGNPTLVPDGVVLTMTPTGGAGTFTNDADNKGTTFSDTTSESVTTTNSVQGTELQLDTDSQSSTIIVGAAPAAALSIVQA